MLEVKGVVFVLNGPDTLSAVTLSSSKDLLLQHPVVKI